MAFTTKPATGQKPAVQIPQQSPEEINKRKQAIAGLHASDEPDTEEGGAAAPPPTGLAAEKPMGALCFLPKSLYRLATRAAEDRDITAKRFFLEAILDSLERDGIITAEQHQDALRLPPEYGWKGRKERKGNKD